MTYPETSKLQLQQFDVFNQYASLKHFVTNRNGGVSKGSFESLNLSYASGDKKSNVDTNRGKLAQWLDIDRKQLYIPRQCHTNNIAVVDDQTDIDGLSNTDGLVTATPGICIAVLVADCVPVLLFDPRRHVIAAVHAGWRGTCSAIAQQAVSVMQKMFGCQPKDIKAGIGPSISPEIYEVGEEVVEAFHAKFKYVDKLIRSSSNKGKYMFDLWLANQFQLRDSGIPASSIEISGICTYQNKQYFSARRMGVQSGRFATGGMILES